MKNAILCEGSTDGILLQYFMRKVYHWEDGNNKVNLFGSKVSWFRTMKKESKRLDIASCRGCSNIISNLNLILEFNYNATKGEDYAKIAIVTDRDETDTEEDFLNKISLILEQNHVCVKEKLAHNEWSTCEYETSIGKMRRMEILILVIPFEQTGAMETFLLKSISENDEYDARIIEMGNQFVENIDPKKKYLTKRRYITKAKFDVYFSIRTAAEQFVQRQNILKDIEWEKYINIQEEFQKLAEL
mgnify:CR=1 FL=1